MATKSKCQVCDKPATVRIIAADADGTVLDEVLICSADRCVNNASGLLAVGKPTQVFRK